MKVGKQMANSNIELELYLVRHGESMSNVGKTGLVSYEMQSDTPLSPLGERQAELLGEYFSELPLDCILSSGLRRAIRTGYEVSIRQPENGARQVEAHKIFTECGTGEDCPGRTAAEIQKELSTVISAVGMGEDEKVIFYGRNDSDEVLLERGKAAIKYIRERFHNGEKVMVTAHAAFNTFMLFAALGLSHEQSFDPTFFNTSITKIIFFKEGTGAFGDVHLECLNTVPHLIGEMPQFKF